MSNYRNPRPEFVGRKVQIAEQSGSAHFASRREHLATIVDAGEYSFACDDGMTYRWEDEAGCSDHASWRWAIYARA